MSPASMSMAPVDFTLPAVWDPSKATWSPRAPLPIMTQPPAHLTDGQLGLHYADLWTAQNSPRLDRVFAHIASQEQRIKELQTK
jgi:hypothetical protein